MAKIKKFQSISKQTPTKKLDNKVLKQKPMKDNKSQSALQPVRKSLRLKPVEEHENPIEEEVGLQVNFGKLSPFLQSIVLCHILENNMSLKEQIEMRRVCRLWHDNVKHIWGKARSLVLTLKSRSIKSKLSNDLHEPKPIDQFNSLQIAKGFELTIGKNRWKDATIELLGELFRNIENLTINYELNNKCDDIAGNLVYFLQKFTKVKAFSLIMPPMVIVGEDFLFRLFKTINDNLAPLHTLHLNIPNYDNPYSAVDIEHIHKTLPYLQNFSFNSTVENLSEILQGMGKSLPARWPIRSLSLNVGLPKLLAPVETLFERNPNLSHMKRLELTGIDYGSFDIVSRLLAHFPELECLNLCTLLKVFEIKFTIDWINALNKLAHLQELYLCNFEIQIFNVWSTRGLDKKSLPNIRKLTIVASYDLYHNIEYQHRKMYNLLSPENFESKCMYGLYLHNLAKQFPKLEELTFKLNGETWDENFSDWCFAEFKDLKSVKLNDLQDDFD